MIDHPFIELQTQSQLEKKQTIKWFETVHLYGPENICTSIELGPNNKQSRFYIKSKEGRFRYIIPLNRNMLSNEIQKIANKWNIEFPDGDFEINWSQSPQFDQKIKEIKDDVLKSIILEATKRAHSIWLNQKISEGWRFGNKLNQREKISPMCMHWDQLNEKYKINEYKRMIGLVDVLTEMGYKLSN